MNYVSTSERDDWQVESWSTVGTREELRNDFRDWHGDVQLMVGSRVFDPKRVGYVTDQSPFKNGTFVADPNNANGNGNGGHEFGTDLSEGERWALIEYLKGL